jgi:hypothetical protein
MCEEVMRMLDTRISPVRNYTRYLIIHRMQNERRREREATEPAVLPVMLDFCRRSVPE